MSARLRTVLVEDEPPARERLHSLLATQAQVEIVGEAGDVDTAAELCAALRPDLIFLDIQLPRASGFDLLPRLDPVPAIIFVTAFDRFAVRAFEINAVDYLLKPVSPSRLALAVARVAAAGPAHTNPPPAGVAATLAESDLVFLRNDRALRVVPASTITHIEAEENYSRVHLVDLPPMLIRRQISDWERMLPPERFVRIDRSLLVQLAAVRALTTESRDVAHLMLAGRREPLVLARRASVRLRQALDAWARS